MIYIKLVKLFLRLTIASGFLSAVADRFGVWGYNVTWGSWDKFIEYTQVLLPYFGHTLVQIIAIIVTALEIFFALFLLIGFKTHWIAKFSGILFLLFGFTLWISSGLKIALDSSVFIASAAAFALSTLRIRFLEVSHTDETRVRF